MIKWIKKITLFLLFAFACSFAQNNFNVLPWNLSGDYNTYLLREVHKQYADRRSELDKALLSRESMIKYREQCRKKYFELLGEMPAKTELNPDITGTIRKNGYRVEKVIYQSIPNNHVTADLYIPEGSGKFPAILLLAGHGLKGKLFEQQIALLYVKNGFVVFAIDPVSQGERFQITDSDGKPLTSRATNEHTLLNAGLNVVGSSVVAFELWDNVRGLDYLETRPEVDKDKIGCVGVSGGGTQTTYLIAFDPRIKVATPVSYISSRERTLEMQGPSDGCQHLPYEGREHLEIADFLIMFAPKPLLIIGGLHDFVDYWGFTQVFEDLKKVYSILGEPEKVAMFSWDDGHGMAKPKRETAVTWFRKWMYNDDTPIKEGNLDRLTETELMCTLTGQVNTSFPNEVNIPERNYFLSNKYSDQRFTFMNKSSDSEINSKVMELLGIEKPTEKIYTEITGNISKENYDIEKTIIRRKGEMPVPCLVYIPKTINDSITVTIYLNEKGKNEIAANDSIINSFIQKGSILILADLRGYGETEDPAELNDPKYDNREYRNAMISLHIGRTVIGQRVIDIMSILDFIDGNFAGKKHITKIIATGTYGPTVMHAMLFDKRINEANLSGSIKSYEQFLQEPLQKNMYTNVLYGVLNYYDLPGLIGKIGFERIRFSDL